MEKEECQADPQRISHAILPSLLDGKTRSPAYSKPSPAIVSSLCSALEASAKRGWQEKLRHGFRHPSPMVSGWLSLLPCLTRLGSPHGLLPPLACESSR